MVCSKKPRVLSLSLRTGASATRWPATWRWEPTPRTRRDGKLDFATANADTSNVSVRLGRGDGTFKKPGTFKAGNGPPGVTEGRFDRGRRPDLALSNQFSKNLSALLNKTRR